MCQVCVSLVSEGTSTLDELLQVRRERRDEGEHGDSVRHTMVSANGYLRALEPQQVRTNTDVQAMVLALAVATERLLALEESGITS